VESKLGPLGTSATEWPIVPAPGDYVDGEFWWNEDWQGKHKYSEKTCPSATLSTTNPTWLDPGLNPGRRCGKPATNRLSYGATGMEMKLYSYNRLNWIINKNFDKRILWEANTRICDITPEETLKIGDEVGYLRRRILMCRK
jgi:hypothetical protein